MMVGSGSGPCPLVSPDSDPLDIDSAVVVATSTPGETRTVQALLSIKKIPV
jgi:hypothetical protein